MIARALVYASVLISCASCATGSKPCREGGDISWQTEIKGDRTCFQKRMPDGKYVNHGKYQVIYPNGQIALEGNFVDGSKEGYWIQYDEKGRKIVEKYFENGVERMAPSKTDER